MEYNITKEPIFLRETIFDDCQEQAIDLDFNLPDYCPDIQKILKCQVFPKVTSRNISSDRLDVDGTTTIRLLYIDAVKSSVRCCEQSVPFSSSFNLNLSPQSAVVFTTSKIEYINCRAISPRRLDVHGAFSLCAKVVAKEAYEFGIGAEESDIEEKKKTVTISNVTDMQQEIFSIEEVVELNPGKPPVESIVRTDVSVCVSDYKVVSEKLIIKGDASIKILYISDLNLGSLETMEYSIPISQIVDVDGLDDNCVCDVHLEILNSNIKSQTDGSGEETLLGVEMKLAATVISYKEKDVDILTDAYSKTYDTQFDYNQISVSRFIKNLNETFIDNNTLEFENYNVARVVDLWNDVHSITAKVENDELVFSGKYNVCILACDREDNPFYIERMIDFSHSVPWNEKFDSIECSPNFCVVSMSYRIVGDGDLEIRVEIKVDAPVYSKRTIKFISGIFIDQEKTRKKDSEAALTIYYADQGEDLWNIAREYCTSVDAIKNENEIDGDVLENRKMLLIPM